MNFYRSSTGGSQTTTESQTYTHTVGGTAQYGTAYQYFMNNTSITTENIVVGDYVSNCNQMLANATSFNGNVSLGANVVDCYNMLYGCNSYNLNVVIPSNVQNCQGMLYECTAFNSNVNFRGTASRNCQNMLYGCTAFNKAVNLTEGITNCSNMFRNDYLFNQSLTIPSTATNCDNMLYHCYNYTKNIYFSGNVENVRTVNMLAGKYNNRKINIFYNGQVGNIWGANCFLRYIINGKQIGLAAMSDGNGYYNSTVNLYYYNNYGG